MASAPEFQDVQAALDAGDFGIKPRLRALLVRDLDVPGAPWPRLWAFTATHAELAFLAPHLTTISRPENVRRIVVSLGLSLSPVALGLLATMHDDFDDEELDEYIRLACSTMLRAQDEPEVDLHSLKEESAAATRAFAPSTYLYAGQPAFPGTLTQELLNAATVALREKRPLVLTYQAELLKAFSGLEVPVGRRDSVDERRFREIVDYVQRIAALPWRTGWKYFHGHPIDGPAS